MDSLCRTSTSPLMMCNNLGIHPKRSALEMMNAHLATQFWGGRELAEEHCKLLLLFGRALADLAAAALLLAALCDAAAHRRRGLPGAAQRRVRGHGAIGVGGHVRGEGHDVREAIGELVAALRAHLACTVPHCAQASMLLSQGPGGCTG